VKTNNWGVAFQVMEGFLEHVLPYLTEEEAGRARAAVRPALDPASGAVIHCALAGILGLHEDLRAYLASLPDGDYQRRSLGSLFQIIALNLGDAREAEAQARRLGLPLTEPEHVHAWLALTGLGGLDYLRACLLHVAPNKDMAEKLTKAVVGAVQAPE